MNIVVIVILLAIIKEARCIVGIEDDITVYVVLYIGLTLPLHICRTK